MINNTHKDTPDLCLDRLEAQHAIPFVALLASRAWYVLDYWGAHTRETRNTCASAIAFISAAGNAPQKFIKSRLSDYTKLIKIEIDAEDISIRNWFSLLSLTLLYLEKIIEEYRVEIVIQQFRKFGSQCNTKKFWQYFLDIINVRKLNMFDARTFDPFHNEEMFILNQLQNNHAPIMRLHNELKEIFQLFLACFDTSSQIEAKCVEDLETIRKITGFNETFSFLFDKKFIWPDDIWEYAAPFARRLEFYRQEELNQYATILVDQATRLGQTLQDIKASVNDIGHVYNAINQFGYIIPGKKQTEIAISGGLKNVSLATTRWGHLTDILGEPPDQGVPPFITAEDIDVCLLAAYGGDSAKIPYFSLEPIGGDFSRHQNWRYDEKIFDPPWISSTNLGRTFFFTDYLMKQISMGNAYVSLIDPTYARPYDGQHSHEIPCWLNEEVANRRHNEDTDDPYLKQNLGGRLCWKLKSVEISRHNTRYYVGNAEVYVEGSSVRRLANGTFDRNYRLNCPLTGSGLHAQAFTENIDRLYQTFPAIVRLRELFKLIYLCYKLKEDNVKLSWKIERRINKFKERLPSSFPKTYAPKAYHRNGCNCDGGTDPRGAVIDPVSVDRLSAARFGTQYHSFEAKVTRDAPNNGCIEQSGFRCIGINQTMGGTKRPDYVYVNDERKIVIVEDVYTGTKFEVGHESVSHYLKGWLYRHEPEIQKLIEDGYRYEYVCSNPRATKH
jgi:hypothetical protein